MEKRKLSILSIVLYVLAGILALYMIWTIVNINEALSAQQVKFSITEFNIVNVYMSNASQYGVFAVVLFSLGWILQKMSPVVKKAVPEFSEQMTLESTGTFADEAAELAQAEDVLSTEEDTAESAEELTK